MAHVTLTINGRQYDVGCDAGQEEHLRTLATQLDRRTRMLAEATGAVAEGIVLVLAGLTLADELIDTKTALEQAELARAAAERDRGAEEAQLAASEHARTALEGRVAEAEQERDALAAKVAEGDDERKGLGTQLAEARKALEQARAHLEQRREEQAALRQQEENVARAIETLAGRIETVARSLAAT